MVRSYARRKKRHYQGINRYDKAQKTQCQSTVIPQEPNSFTTIASAKKNYSQGKIQNLFIMISTLQ